ncbi:MAG: hypothetical protein ACPGGL_09450, partial [Phycisphaerales bacterium]
YHSIGLREDGTIACWGSNNYGQCDAPDGVFTQVEAGDRHSLGLREDGTIACWGDNAFGQCNSPDGVFTQVAGGVFHSMGLRLPLGACCTGNTVGCVETLEKDCNSALGLTWLGANTSCANSQCPTTCEGDATGNGIVDFADLIAVLNNWGPCSG